VDNVSPDEGIVTQVMLRLGSGMLTLSSG